MLTAWDELVLETLNLAKIPILFEDLDYRARNSIFSVGKSYGDRMRVIRHLLECNSLCISNGYLVIPEDSQLGILEHSFKEGSEAAWNLVEELDKSGALEGKFCAQLREEIGLDAELEVIRQIKDRIDESLHDEIEHVSLRNDFAGFDILAPSTVVDSAIRRIEVKCSSRKGSIFDFYISRNEANVAGQSREWALVGVEKTENFYQILGHLHLYDFIDDLPKDSSPTGKWQSCKISIEKKRFITGLP